jgi:hypothetical protein
VRAAPQAHLVQDDDIGLQVGDSREIAGIGSGDGNSLEFEELTQ